MWGKPLMQIVVHLFFVLILLNLVDKIMSYEMGTQSRISSPLPASECEYTDYRIYFLKVYTQPFWR